MNRYHPVRFARHYLWIAPVLIGLLFIAAGSFMIVQGRDAKNEVRSQLLDERITTSSKSSIPGVPVNDVKTAQAQADVIKADILAITNNKTYAELDRNDPNRAQYLNSVTLRTALSLAIMGFKVSDLVMGIGAFMVAIGAVNIVVMAPALFWAWGHQREHFVDPKPAPAGGRPVTAPQGT